MGKYALLLVAAFSVAGAKLLFSSQETDVKASQGQSEYDADLIAREIARSAYNGAVADANLKGTDIPAALLAVGPAVVSETQSTENKCAGGVPVCYRRQGSMQGGTYRVEASVTGGNRVDVYARGQYDYTTVQSDRSKPNYGQQIRAPKTYEINEMRAVGVLQVARSGILSIQFIDSQAGYCSAIFLQRTPAGGVPGPMEMVYVPGHNRNGDRNVGLERELEPGVQMNFAIGVETGCAMQNKYFNPANAQWNAAKREYVNKSGGNRMYFLRDSRNQMVVDSVGVQEFMAGYTYRAADWNWIHWALDGGSLTNGNPQEAPWGMVETDLDNTQRWRISFEDIDNWNLLPSNPGYNNPNLSLWATKRFGYDTNNDGIGDGWKDVRRNVVTEKVLGRPEFGYNVTESAGSDGFHDLRDTGSPADFSDQVIMVEVRPMPTGGSTRVIS